MRRPEGDAIVACAEALELYGSEAHAKRLEAKALAAEADPPPPTRSSRAIRALIDRAPVIYP